MKTHDKLQAHLVTAEATLTPAQLSSYLRKVDSVGDSAFFVYVIEKDHGASPVTLILHVDGDSTETTVRLNADGTWVAETLVVVGTE